MIPGNANPLLLATAAADAAAAGPTRSLRFNGADQAYLSRTFSSAGNTRTWTLSFWIKKVRDGGNWIFAARSPLNDSLINLVFNGNDEFEVGHYSFSSIRTARKYRDYSSWYHIVLAVDTTQATASNRIRVYTNGVEETSFTTATYPAQNTQYNVNTASLHTFAQSGSDYGSHQLADIYHIDGSQLDPTSFGAFDDNGVWQAAEYSGTFGTNGFHLKFDDASSNAALGTDSSGNGNTFTVNNLIAAQFSPTATVVGDPTSSTDNPFGSGNGHSVLFDGNDSIRFSGPGLLTGDVTIECFVKIDSSGQSGYRRAFSTNEAVYSSEQSMIRRKNDGSFQFYFGDGTAEETDDTVDTNTWHHAAITYDQSASAVSYYVDGTRVGTDTYSGTVRITEMVVAGGMTNENWIGNISNCRITKQVLYSGTSYTVPTSTLTTTSQGATASNVVMLCCHQSSTTAVEGSFSAASDTDCLFDVPTNGSQSDTGAGGEVSGNYCTLNPLDKDSNVTLSNGNLDAATSSSAWSGVKGTLGVSSGKHYFEFTYGDGSSGRIFVGICSSDVVIDPSSNIQDDSTERAKGMLLFCDDGQTQLDTNSRASAGTTPATGDIIGVSFDLDGNTAQFYQNGSALGSIDISSSPLASTTVVPIAVVWQSGVNHSLNFGQRAWAYSAPSNHKALCTTNLPTATVPDGSDYFNTALYTGNDSTRSITGVGHNPDLVWIKTRSQANDHVWVDSVRGVGERLFSNSTSTESTQAASVTSFDSDGFSLGSHSSVNQNNVTHVAWCWDAGTSTASNTAGDITTSLRANTTAGFSIATYSGSGTNGDEIGHGLGVQPDLCIIKARNKTDDWRVYHSALGTGKTPALNSSNAASSGANWQSISNTTLGLQNDPAINGSGYNYVAYFFAAVAGYSAFGSYTGNGSTDGPFVYTGFRPRWVMIKNSSANSISAYGSWKIIDTTRDSYNGGNPAALYANASYAEGKRGNGDSDTFTERLDLLSNGFKLGAASSYDIETNESGVTYIYAAFAENPFQANGGLAR